MPANSKMDDSAITKKVPTTEQYFATRSFFNFENLPPSRRMAPLSTTASIDPVDEVVSTCIHKAHHATLRDSRQRGHRVTFAAEVEIHEIAHIKEMSVDEWQALYYSRGDYRRIAKENNATLRLMKQRCFPGTEKLYFRGLERKLPKARHESHQRVWHAVDAVLDEQQFGIINPYWVNNFYCAYTLAGTNVAHMMGLWDAEAMKAEEEATVLQDKSQADRRWR
jgi:hypothetical protein